LITIPRMSADAYIKEALDLIEADLVVVTVVEVGSRDARG